MPTIGSQKSEQTNNLDEKDPNVRLVKCSGPILIKDASKTEEENQILKDSLLDYDEVFDYVYPPEEWEENGKTWRQIASTKPVTRAEVIDFEKEFRSQLKYWQVREQGLCRARRELFSQCFDEIIRQECVVSIDCGTLLIRIRDEFNATLKAYKQLFENCLMFSTRESNIANSLEKVVKSLEEKNLSIKNMMIKANAHYINLKENIIEELKTLKAANDHEIDFFTTNHGALKEQLNSLLSIELK